MLLPWILCGILAVVLIVACVKNYMLKKSMDEIRTEFERCLSEDTNVQISISSGDKTARAMAKAINRELSALRKMKQQYTSGDRELKEAIVNISHDLRTPLTSICGYVDLIKKQELSEDSERYINLIEDRANLLKLRIEELFRYSIITGTVNMLTIENVCLNNILENSIAEFYFALKERNIKPIINITDQKVFKNLDKTATARVFENIITNALKYSDGDLIIKMDDSGVIEFLNSSSELSSVDVEKLFDRFFTVSSARKSTGLGLSIAKILVENMGGMIEGNYANGMLSVKISF